MPNPITPHILVDTVSFSYGETPVLDHISFEIQHGDYVALVGPNGGGKTTLINIILGLVRPSGGTVRIDGVSIHEARHRFPIGYVPQESAQENRQFPATVYETIESGRTPFQKPFHRATKHDRDTIQNAMQRASIEHLASTPLAHLSGGQRQRVFVARALASEPSLLILDEPFVGVDIKAQTDFYEFLRTLNTERGITILFVTHDIDVIMKEAKTMLCLNTELLCHGSPNVFHEQHMIERLYGQRGVHIHHHHSSHNE